MENCMGIVINKEEKKFFFRKTSILKDICLDERTERVYT